MKNAHGYTPEEIQKRQADLHRDADLIASGWTPKPSDLKGAAHLDNWSKGHINSDQFVLMGTCLNHPKLRPGPVQTSLVIAIDEKAGWMRTMGRFYTLGKPYVRVPIEDRLPPSAEPMPSAPQEPWGDNWQQQIPLPEDDDDALAHYPGF